ncbi:conserved hypothetical protein [uncultured delta proteobacterium]|uniref:DUF3987 domain-containing protein n=1 Tax=uncultured delta proteobacterium TaxID=34034 RepID=A0A212K2E2_9DELT|nr:conserved hypothetical protein [uncultured delta proteobacterium]
MNEERKTVTGNTLPAHEESGASWPVAALLAHKPPQSEAVKYSTLGHPAQSSAGHTGAAAMPEESWTQITPIPFDNQQAPAIPRDSIPGIIGEYAAAVAESIQVPFEVPLVNVFGSVAAVVQRKFQAQMHIGYSEPLNIFALASLPPGERKSAAKDACRFPLLDWEEEQQRRVVAEIKQAQAEQQVQEEAVRSLLTAAKKCQTAEDRRELARHLSALKDEAKPLPVPPRLLADDTTPEALAALMAQHGQKIAMIESEGGFFDTLAGRYSSGVPNLDAVLKSWSGEAIRIDRRHAEPILLDNPTLTLILSAQPDVLAGAALTPSFRGRGLLGRLLFFIPQSRIGSRSIETHPLPEALKQRYRATLLHLLALPWNTDSHGNQIPYMLALEPEAKSAWLNFAADVETSLAEGGNLAGMRDWGGKLPGQVLRLAGLCHVTLHECPQEHGISTQTMNAVITLAGLLIEHAKVAYALMGVDDAIECARAILKWIRQEKLERFTGRACLERVKGRWPKMSLIDPGLTVLEERGYIRSADPRDTKRGPGRPSRNFLVNPRAHD